MFGVVRKACCDISLFDSNLFYVIFLTSLCIAPATHI